MKKWYVVIENQFGELGDSHGPYEKDTAEAMLPYEKDQLRDGGKMNDVEQRIQAEKTTNGESQRG